MTLSTLPSSGHGTAAVLLPGFAINWMTRHTYFLWHMTKLGLNELTVNFTLFQRDLFTKLIAQRNRLSQEKGVPTFVLFNNKSLLDMAKCRWALQIHCLWSSVIMWPSSYSIQWTLRSSPLRARCVCLCACVLVCGNSKSDLATSHRWVSTRKM